MIETTRIEGAFKKIRHMNVQKLFKMLFMYNQEIKNVDYYYWKMNESIITILNCVFEVRMWILG